MSRTLANVSAFLFAVWGVLHIEAALKTFELANALEPTIVQGRVYQDAAILLATGIGTVLISITMVRRNSKTGFWVSVGITSVADISFIVFILVPGYVPLWPGLTGPVAWVLAMVFQDGHWPRQAVAPQATRPPCKDVRSEALHSQP